MQTIEGNMSKLSIQKLNVRLNSFYQLQDEIEDKLNDIIETADDIEEEDAELADSIRSEANDLLEQFMMDDDQRVLFGEEMKGISFKNAT
jgi:gas vesicle protein